jgi:hypothetical protein
VSASISGASYRSERGAILLVALVFGAVIAISLGSYVALNTHSLKMSNRSFYLAEAMNMAESGLEEAIWAFNQAQAGEANAWSSWDTSDGITAKGYFTDFLLGANATGSVKVYVDRYNPPASFQPKVIAQASITLPGGQGTITKMVEARMRRRSYFAAGLVAKNNLTFSGNGPSVDSWISDPDNNTATAAVAYSTDPTVRRDKGSIAAAGVYATLTVGNADIWGTAAVGGPTASNIDIKANGRIGPFGVNSGIDPASVATDFNANLNIVSAPTTGTVLASIGSTLGTTGTTTVWRAPSLTDPVTISGNVTLILTAAPGVRAIDISGLEAITLTAGSTFTIYTAGDMNISGNAVVNNNAQPDTFQIWGTSTSPTPQDIQIGGNGDFKGLIYAPNGNISLVGNGNVMGAVVGNQIDVTGNAAFHYDESLAGWTGETPFGVYKWREILSVSERATNAALLAF